MSYVKEPHTHSKIISEVGLNLFNYATKHNLKNTRGVNTSNFAKKTD